MRSKLIYKNNDIDLDKLTPQQIELLDLFEKVPDEKKSIVIDIVRSFTKGVK